MLETNRPTDLVESDRDSRGKRQRESTLTESQVASIDADAKRIRKMGDSDEQKQYRAWGSIGDDNKFLVVIRHCPICSCAHTGAYRGAAEPLGSKGGYQCRGHLNNKGLRLSREICKSGRIPNVTRGSQNA